MSYLPFTHKSDAELRNSLEAFRRQCQAPTIYWWPMTELNGVYYLNVGDGEGLSDTELTQTKNEI